MRPSLTWTGSTRCSARSSPGRTSSKGSSRETASIGWSSPRLPDPGGRAVYLFARALQFTGLLVTGIAFFDGVVGGNVRRELVLLVAGAAVFFLGRALQPRR